jgi:hypothetical protein
MKIREITRYPHPILGVDTGDYANGDFKVQFEARESRSGRVSIAYTVELTEESVWRLVTSGNASIGVYVGCLRTYYNILHPLELKGGDFVIEKGMLLDSVEFLPVIYTISGINNFSSKNLHEEFGNNPWSFQPDDMIAIGEKSRINVGLDKLAPMESIFTFELDEDIPYGQILSSLEDQKIAIRLNKKTMEGINYLRDNKPNVTINSVFLPVVMEVLSAIGEDKGIYETYDWYRVFTAKCSFLGIELGKGNLLEDAQKLLASPLKKLLINEGV